MKTGEVETVQLNRKFMPAALKTAKLKKGEKQSYYPGKLMAMKWKEKDDTILDTLHADEFIEYQTH